MVALTDVATAAAADVPAPDAETSSSDAPPLTPDVMSTGDVDGDLVAPGDWTMLETVTPEVQWLAAGFASWVSIPTGQLVRAGDRVRTGSGAAARIRFAPDTAMYVGAASDLTVRRLEQGPAGNLVAELWLASGTTAGPMLPTNAPTARVEIETPAALIVARRAGPRIEVGADGTTHVSAPSDAPAGTITIEGKDAQGTVVILGPGERTDVAVGSAPTPLAAAPLPP